MADKPKSLVIWSDGIGQRNLSCYSNGLPGYRAPNVDRLAEEGALFPAADVGPLQPRTGDGHAATGCGRE